MILYINKTKMEAVQQVSNQVTNQVTKTEQNTKKPRQFTYWAIELDNSIFEQPEVKEFLAANPHLVPLNKVHSTLLFVGGSKDPVVHTRAAEVSQHKDKRCVVETDGFGYSDKACALSVTSIMLEDIGEVMPSYPNKHQHVTLALSAKTKAVESVETLVRPERTFTTFPDKLVLYGTVRGMF